MTARDLPIYELEAELVRSLRAGDRAIVQAPTGSGKSTQVPQILIQNGLAGEGGQVVVLQPRRLATRMLARRVAEETGCPLGAEVGYQVRLDSRVSDRTRIRFVTEGILLRQIAFDSTLRGIGALVFDEFHERHLYGDITLGRALQIQRSARPDLKLIVMSATLETADLRAYLEPCAMLQSAGRMHPVEIAYLPRAVDVEREPLWEVAAHACEQLASRTPGDLLVFMPGAYEIGRTVQAIQALGSLREFAVLPLHGELPPDQQDRAVARHTGRRIIVSTNVAETSLTIEGVTAVIDSGLARMARFDPHRGINTLLIERISIASADQRAGRAGRTAPGICLRLWTEREHAKRPRQEMPEVRRLDLAEVVLALKAGGVDDVAGFPWLESPDAKALARAEALLADLGALGAGDGAPAVPESPGRGLRITEIGRKMLHFPVHPRYARLLLSAGERGCVRTIAMLAALTQGRNLLLRGVSRETAAAREDLLGEEHESDFFLLLRAWRYAERLGFSTEACRKLGVHAVAARQVAPLFQQFLTIAEREGLPVAEGRVDGNEIRKCILSGFSDQLARRLDRGTLRCEVVHGRRGQLSRDSGVTKAPLLVAAEISEVEGRGGEINVILSLATAVEESWLREIFPDDYRETRNVSYDSEMKRVVTRRERRFRDLVLDFRAESEEAPLNEAAALLTREVLAGRLKLEAWDDAVEQWITRVNRLAEWFPELEVNPITDPDRATLVEQICYGELGYRGIRDKPVMPVLRDWLTAEQLAALDVLLPERLEMPNGRRSRLTYAREGPPVLSARIQELFGISGRITVGQGRIPVRIQILAPNQRPIQITDDLTEFWRQTYPDIRTRLSRRYPRHEWR